MAKKHIKNIIFDLGGVILNIDFEATIKAFEDLGVQDVRGLKNELISQKILEKFEKGHISPVEFRTFLHKYIDKKITDQDIDKAWNAILLDYPDQRIKLIKNLSGQYRLFLLSNTNQIHYNEYYDFFGLRSDLKNLSDLFEKEYYSFKEGFRKPEKEFYLKVINENKLSPDQTLFVDDTFENIESADEVGLKTLWINGYGTIETEVPKALELKNA